MGPQNAREMALFGYAWTRPGILPCLAVTLSPLQFCHCRGVRCQGAEWILRKLASLKHEWTLLLLCQRAEPSWVGGQGELAGGARELHHPVRALAKSRAGAVVQKE